MVSKVLCSSLIMVTYYFSPGNATWFLKLYGSLKASSIVSSLTSSLVSNETHVCGSIRGMLFGIHVSMLCGFSGVICGFFGGSLVPMIACSAFFLKHAV